VNQVGWFVNS